MRLFWTPEALDDRRAIFDYIEADNPMAALNLDESKCRHVMYGRLAYNMKMTCLDFGDQYANQS